MSTVRRAGETRGALSRGLAALVPPPVPVEVLDEPPAEVVTAEPVVAAPVVPTKERTSKFTANLDPKTAAAFDELALVARRKLERRVEKIEVLKALIMLAADDASLRDQEIAEVRERLGR
jgi:hypothetical protein